MILKRRILQKRVENLTPPPDLTVSEWADEYRRLSPESAAEPGRWRTDRAAYQRGIMDAFSEPGVETVVVMSSAQIGKTEILNNVVGYHVDQDPSPIMVLQPTLEMAHAWSKDRLAPMVRDTPNLRGKIKDPRSRDSGNTLLHKVFPGGHITMSGANSPASLASRPIRVLLGDEIDRYPFSAGNEGDPIMLARKRTATFWNRRIGLWSTPTLKGFSRIEDAFEESDKRRYHVPCPKCGEMQTLDWSSVRWDQAEDGKHLPETARVECSNQKCEAGLDDAARRHAIKRGEWRATAEAAAKGTVGFHLNELYSPWRRLSEIVTDFLMAKGNPERLKAWVNTSLGETWEEKGQQLKPDSLIQRREPYSPEALPNGVLFITAGIDVQDDRLELEIVGWGADYESWGVKFDYLTGDPGGPDLWKRMDETIQRRFHTQDGRSLGVVAACVDSGGHYTEQVYKFCKPRFSRNIWAIKGMPGMGYPLVGRPSKRNKAGCPLYPVGVDTAKELLLLSRLKVSEPGPGYCHFPHDYGEEYFEQLTSEKCITKWLKGRKTRAWELPKGKRNEALDCRNYATAAAEALRPNFQALLAKAQRAAGADDIEQPTDPDALPTKTVQVRGRPRSVKRRKGGYQNNWRK